jgi:hypothetical protein
LTALNGPPNAVNLREKDVNYKEENRAGNGRGDKKKNLRILTMLKEMIADKEFQSSYKQQAKDFMRQRVLTFPKVVIGLINLMNRSLAVELAKLLHVLDGLSASFCSKQAFSKQRQKLKPEAFVALNSALLEQFYADTTGVKTFGDFLLLAIDGSTLQLPQSKDLIQEYGQAANQQSSMPMARCSLLYDILNKLSLEAILAPYRSDERSLAWQHLEFLAKHPPGNGRPLLLLFDRGYPSIALIARLQAQGIYFVMRVKEKTFMQEVADFAASGKQQQVLDLDVSTSKRKNNKQLQEALKQLDEAALKVRVLAIELPTKEKEYLLSNLLDEQSYDRDFFSLVYQMRWGIETQYGFEKTLLEIENFSSKNVTGIQQDFHASILCSNILALLNADAGQQMEKQAEQRAQQGKVNKQVYGVNRAVSLGLMKDEIAAMLFGSQPLEQTYELLLAKIIRNKSCSKPGRHYSRIRKRPRKPKINRRRPT